jgi:hypothetical protein
MKKIDINNFEDISDILEEVAGKFYDIELEWRRKVEDAESNFETLYHEMKSFIETDISHYIHVENEENLPTLSELEEPIKKLLQKRSLMAYKSNLETLEEIYNGIKDGQYF